MTGNGSALPESEPCKASCNSNLRYRQYLFPPALGTHRPDQSAQSAACAEI